MGGERLPPPPDRSLSLLHYHQHQNVCNTKKSCEALIVSAQIWGRLGLLGGLGLLEVGFKIPERLGLLEMGFCNN